LSSSDAYQLGLDLELDRKEEESATDREEAEEAGEGDREAGGGDQ
jgi:hypothetical protein